MLVSPTISNLKFTKMLVDGGARLDLISLVVVNKLQIGEEELEAARFKESIPVGAVLRERLRCR